MQPRVLYWSQAEEPGVEGVGQKIAVLLCLEEGRPRCFHHIGSCTFTEQRRGRGLHPYREATGGRKAGKRLGQGMEGRRPGPNLCWETRLWEGGLKKEQL